MLFKQGKSGYLILEDGVVFYGDYMYNPQETFAEAVFNTSHSGYQEILTDPSYSNQFLVFTAPHIGNVGINSEDYESSRVQAAGAVLRNLSPLPRNWRSETGFVKWLAESNIPLLVGANTRGITLHLRKHGAMRAGLFPKDVSLEDALEKVRRSESMAGADLASRVTCQSQYSYKFDSAQSRWHRADESGRGLKVAVLDFGVKKNILQELTCRGCDVTVLPAQTSADEIIKGGYHGLLASNGPGDPAAVKYAIDTVRELIGKLPLFGICLGHQILSLAAGLQTFKLPFGHRGSNHPVRRESDKQIEITSQNHGFAVRSEGIGNDWRITHLNLNDATVEGIEHTKLPLFSIQYHPEASPGPHDSLNYFDRFVQEMKSAAQ